MGRGYQVVGRGYQVVGRKNLIFNIIVSEIVKLVRQSVECDPEKYERFITRFLFSTLYREMS